jgi:hypothetical protein
MQLETMENNVTLSAPIEALPNTAINTKSVTEKEGWPRYLLFLNGRWRWRPTKAMRAHSFALTTFGADFSDHAIQRARLLNDEWDRCRKHAGRGKIHSQRNTAAEHPPGPKRLRRRFRHLYQDRMDDGYGPAYRGTRMPGTRSSDHSRHLQGIARREAALHGKYATYRLRGRREGRLEDWIKAGCPFGVWFGPRLNAPEIFSYIATDEDHPAPGIARKITICIRGVRHFPPVTKALDFPKVSHPVCSAQGSRSAKDETEAARRASNLDGARRAGRIARGAPSSPTRMILQEDVGAMGPDRVTYASLIFGNPNPAGS